MMRRSRSPVRFELNYTRERSFSISSLSSCNIGNEDGHMQHSKKNMDRNNRKHKRRNRGHSKNNFEQDRTRGASNDKLRDRNHSDSNNFFSSATNSARSKNNPIMDESLDPSICNFRGSGSYSVMQDDIQETRKGQGEDRLDRLEKMMEVIMHNKSQVISGKVPSDHADPRADPPILSDELIPRNTHFTTSMWLNKINEECFERNFDEKTCIKYVESKMTGIIKAWYKSLDFCEYTWPELKMLITKSFPDNTDFACTLRLLVERVKIPDETITQYYFSKMYLLEACKISGVNAVSCLIAGLTDPYLQQEAKANNFLTPETLYAQFLCKLSNYGLESEPNYGAQSQQVQHDFDIQAAYPLKDEPHPYRTKNAKMSKKKCFTCGKFGHIAEDCRHAPVCYKCGLMGHIAAKCSHM